MTITMTESHVRTVAEIRNFLNHRPQIAFRRKNRTEAYAWFEKVLMRLKYETLKKPDKGAVRAYLGLITGYSRAQITRLIGFMVDTGHVKPAVYKRHRFARKYTDSDIQLLATRPTSFTNSPTATLSRRPCAAWPQGIRVIKMSATCP